MPPPTPFCWACAPARAGCTRADVGIRPYTHTAGTGTLIPRRPHAGAGGDKPRPYARACAVIRACRLPLWPPGRRGFVPLRGNSVSGCPRASRPATHPRLQMAGGDKPRPYAGPVRSSASVGAVLVAARPPRICAASETACQAARVSPSRPHSHASRWRAGTGPAPTPGPVWSSVSVGRPLWPPGRRGFVPLRGNSVSGGPRVSKSATQPCLQMAGGDKPRPYARACAVIRVCRGGLVAARTHDSGRVKWARGRAAPQHHRPGGQGLGHVDQPLVGAPRNRAA